MSEAPVLALEAITKLFPGVRALSGISLELRAGQVTALIGENGAGKSTIVKILTGIYQPDAGNIFIDGKPIRFGSPQDAAAAGITAIHQETVLFDDLSVAENVWIGHAPRGRFGLIDRGRMEREAGRILERIGAGSLDPRARLRNLGIASKHLVAIARALSIDSRVVVMDEPTAALSRKEIEELYELVERLKAEGRAILFISHKFDEIFRIADNYVVFRDGEPAGKGLISEVEESALVEMMVGRSMGDIFPPPSGTLGEEILTVQGYSHPTEFDDLSFTLRRGEILGFYGLVGAGRSELMQSLFGITRPSSGTITLERRALSISSPADAIAEGIVYVPEDRGGQGAITGLPIFRNVALPSMPHTAHRGFVQMSEEFALAREYTERLELKAASLDQLVGQLSGGNQQKVVIAKWLATKPAVIILDEPTKGVDIGSKAAVHAFMRELSSAGLAVIMVSSEIPEVLGMSDRVIVMREGRHAATFQREEATPAALVRAAAGIVDQVAA